MFCNEFVCGSFCKHAEVCNKACTFEKTIMMKRLYYVLPAAAMLILSACGGGKYAATEKVYKKKAKEFSGVYKEAPVTGQLEKKLRLRIRNGSHPSISVFVSLIM